MSADNGVYIHRFRNGWRVAEGQAVENIYWNARKKEMGEAYNHKALRDYFSNSPLFKTEEDAWRYAQRLYKLIMDEFGIVEYGIQVI